MITKHYGDKDGLRVLSYNAIFNFVNSNRNYGKTWTFLKRAFRRAVKHGKKTIWLRMFVDETKEVKATIFRSSDLCKYCGVEWYDKEKNTGNLKQIGKALYCRKNNHSPWFWFLKMFTISNPDALRSADDVDVDTIVFDEYTKTIEKQKRFRGNVASNFLDALFSAKREHEVICIFLGNKEGFNNPFYNYFHIKAPLSSFEGIRSYKEGSIVIQQINNKPNEDGDYNRKLKAALKGTSYGNYIYKSEYKGATGLKTRKMPPNATLYVQLYINGVALKISSLNGYYYVNRRVDETKAIYSITSLPHHYRKERLLVRRQRQYFYAFIEALSLNAVCYDSEETYEAITPFLKWLAV